MVLQFIAIFNKKQSPWLFCQGLCFCTALAAAIVVRLASATIGTAVATANKHQNEDDHPRAVIASEEVTHNI